MSFLFITTVADTSIHIFEAEWLTFMRVTEIDSNVFRQSSYFDFGV